MGLFHFRTPRKELTEAEQKWNLMWDMWVKGKADSPYAELMEYIGEVNNGGHDQYFVNMDNCGDLKNAVERLLEILPNQLGDNLKKGYDAFSSQNEPVFEEYDAVFYENEQLLTDILKGYADTLKL